MNRQTATFLSQRLTDAGLRPLSRFGQNFLIDLNLVDLIARSAEIRPCDVVLEIGTGVGSLTTRLADAAGAVLTVEIDRNLFQLASEELAGRPNVKMIFGDALRNKNALRDDILENITEALDRIGPEAKFMMVANLPYNVATPIISNLLRTERPPDRIVATIQKELADRMVAVPSTKDYGAMSVWLQSLCDIEIVRTLPPKVFWPQPKVHSAIVRLDLDHDRHRSFADLEFFHQTTRSLFFHRRKFLRSVVISAMKGRLEKQAVDEVLAAQNLDGDIRAETLTVPQVQSLVEAIRFAVA